MTAPPPAAPSRLDLPHHDGSPDHVETTDPALGDRVWVRARVPAAAGVRTVHVRTTPDAEPAFTAARMEDADEGGTWWRASIVVRNPTTSYRFLLDGPGGYRWLTAAGVVGHDPTDATDFVLSAHPAPPAWAADAICYQVFPDRFAASGTTRQLPGWASPADWDAPVERGGAAAMRQLYGGDLDGITARLEHIADLGANLLYLTPFFPAESNHRYNATAFDHVDPLLGGDEALARLSRAAHERGLRLIGDLTLNHTGDRHEWFRTAQADPGSDEAGFYYFGAGGPDDYESWLGVRTLPKLDHASAELRRRLYAGPASVAARWLSPPWALDGWRIDVANMTGRHGPVDRNAEVAATLAATMRAAGDKLLIAEHAHDASGDLDGPGWHGTMNYAGFTRQAWCWLADSGSGTRVDFLGTPVPLRRLGGRAIARSLDVFRSAVSWRAGLHSLVQLGSHDTARFRTVAGSTDLTLVGAAMLMTAVGIPMVFAGDELGLEGVDNEDARRPIPWDRSRWDTRLHDGYRALMHLRRAHAALRRGGFRWAWIDEDCLVHLRALGDERILVQLARAAHPPVRLEATALGARRAHALLNADDLTTSRDGWVELPADGPAARIWLLER